MSASNRRRAIYEIEVQGELGEGWKEWFDEMAIATTYASEQPPRTTLLGPVPDQAALRGMLCKLWDLNLTVLSLRRIAAQHKEEKADE